MRSAARWSRLVAASVLITGGAAIIGASPAAAVTPCSSGPGPVRGTALPDVPYPLRRYAPDRLAPLSTREGVTVALIDSRGDAPPRPPGPRRPPPGGASPPP